MWKEFLSSIGIGGAEVDTILAKKEWKQGEKAEGKVIIKGGPSEQPVESIILTLSHHYEQVNPDSDFSHRIQDLKELVLPIERNIQPEEEISIPFSIELDSNHPVTEGDHKTFLKTTAVIGQGLDPSDEDEVIILSQV
ncbi:sporulation protein [Bacillus thermotolerans]|uniref:Sporulation control protein Spo0M n=1 Tax=Bacillus thermotolerans TaxID=1221996 RepID=A0A0F5HLW6_BACTR|nr:sporulation protein [Bacillus thermotolerans]KKB33827.1 Sporulation control protein Spo0M [Bacillus thermotolerans]KKB37321.1 Sporulation control protein Spo0M [Bacillus thermotolerans]